MTDRSDPSPRTFLHDHGFRKRTRPHSGLLGLTLIPLLMAASCDAAMAVEPSILETMGPTGNAMFAAQIGGPPPATSMGRSFKRPPWFDADGDCQTTRTEVLVLEARGPIEFEDERRCKVTSGTWRCPYTGEWISDPRLLDIDHVVPLKNAWDSGASAWTNERWRQYANELDHAEHLIATSASANRSKGARGPDRWLPSLAEYRCTYVRDWAAIKATWKLGASNAETQAIAGTLALCDSGKIPPLPQEAQAQTRVLDMKNPAECCKICRKGSACGDTCISSEEICNVGPGCACDG